MSEKTAALTGGTGFLGRYIIVALAQAGWRIRLLTRRSPMHPMLADIPLELVLGDLHDQAALTRLVAGADVVIHAAALVKAQSRAEFFAVNAAATRRLAEICAGTAARFVMISSQAARLPELSDYAASKRAGEAALGGNSIVLRPSVIYGPWDEEGLAMLRLARRRVAPMPRAPEPRIAMIFAPDVADAVVAVSEQDGPCGIFEISDGCAQGHGWREILRQFAGVMGKRPLVLPLPDTVFYLAGAAADGLAAVRRRPTIFGRQKVREILHRDWRPDPAMPLPPSIWTPKTGFAAGAAATVSWWREMGFLD